MKNINSLFPIATLVLLFGTILSYTLFNMHNQGFDFINFFTANSNDKGELFLPVDNLLKNGIYSLDGKTPYTDRIPGISIVYFPLRLLFPPETAFTLLTLIPLLMHLGIIIFLYLKFSIKFGRFKSFIFSTCIIILTPFCCFSITMPESYSTIFTVIAFLILFDFFKISAPKKFIFSGIFFMMTATFRGYLMPSVFALTFLFFVYYLYTHNVVTASKQSLLFILPLFLYLGIWTTRNYIAKSELIILQTNERSLSHTYKPSTQETKKTLKLMGFETVKYYPNSPMNYILGISDNPPNDFFNTASKFSIKQKNLDSLRNLTITNFNKESARLENKLIKYNEKLRDKIKSETSILRLYLFIPAKNFARGFFYNFTSDWGLPAWNNANIIEKGYRLFVYGLFHFSFFLSLILSIIALYKKRKVFIALTWIIWTSSMFFTYTYLINVIEFKYFLTLFPLAPIIFALLTEGLFLKEKKNLSSKRIESI